MPPRSRVLPCILLGIALLCGALSAARAQTDDFVLKARFGIGGRYRPGTWYPVTVTVVNNSGAALSGQIQVYPAANADRVGMQAASAALLSSSQYGCSAEIAASAAPQVFSLLVRNIDPARDDVTVQLVEGSARGDGRVRAKLSTAAAGQSSAISGLPVDDQDLLLVGFGGDTTAFGFLGGQKIGLTHTPGGPGPLAAVPSQSRFYPRRSPPGLPGSVSPAPAVQIGAASVSDLPDKPAGYSGVDAFLLRADAPVDALTEAQAAALKGWVASGGALIVCGGADPSRFSSSFYTDFLPARIGATVVSVAAAPTGAAAGLSLAAKPTSGVRVLSQDAGGKALAVAGPYGAGEVVVLAFDPTTLPYQTWRGAPETAFWRQMLTAGSGLPLSLLGYIAAREEGGAGYGWGQPQFADAVIRAPALDAPGIGTIAIFLLAYLLILVPVNYLVLKRLDRKEWAWTTIPALVALFAVGTYGVGYSVKGSALFVNRSAVVETSAGRHLAGVYAALGLFSPRRTSYDLTLPDPNALAALPGIQRGYGGRPSGNNDQANAYGQTRFVETDGGAAVQDAAINMWAMRAFDVQTVTDLGGSVDSTLRKLAGQQIVRGALTNHLPGALTDCALYYNGQWQTLGDLASGSSRSVTLSALPPPNPIRPGYVQRNPGAFQIPTGGGGVSNYGRYTPGYATQTDQAGEIHQRMESALADFARSLSDSPDYYGGSPPPLYAPGPHEAILIGWSRDPALAGPAPRVDGHAVTENDVSLLVVHIPVR